MMTNNEDVTRIFEKINQMVPNNLEPAEELIFYREILDRMKVNVYITQIDDVDDFTTARMVWINKDCQEAMGYSLEEARAKGYRLFLESVHPDDISVTQHAIDYHTMKEGDVYGGLARFVNKRKEVKWFLGTNVVLNKKNGRPWQFLNVAVNINDEINSQKQLLELQRENLRLKNSLRINTLTKREKTILELIANGYTDKKIADELRISNHTARTHHRNILRKLGKTKSAELAVFASESGLL